VAEVVGPPGGCQATEDAGEREGREPKPEGFAVPNPERRSPLEVLAALSGGKIPYPPPGVRKNKSVTLRVSCSRDVRSDGSNVCVPGMKRIETSDRAPELTQAESSCPDFAGGSRCPKR
jgi:hypothetical protein